MTITNDNLILKVVNAVKYRLPSALFDTNALFGSSGTNYQAVLTGGTASLTELNALMSSINGLDISEYHTDQVKALSEVIDVIKTQISELDEHVTKTKLSADWGNSGSSTLDSLIGNTDISTGTLGSGYGTITASIATLQAAASVSDFSDLTGSASSGQIADGAITSAKIAPNAVGSSEIAAGAVGSSELATDAVTAAKMADSSVSGGYLGTIQDYSISQYDLGTDSVVTSKIQNDAVTQDKIDNQWAYDGTSNLEDMLGARPLTASITESIGAQRLHNNFDRDTGASSLTAASIKEAVRSVVDNYHEYDSAEQITNAISRAFGGYGHLADQVAAPLLVELNKIADRDTNDFAYVMSQIYYQLDLASNNAASIAAAIIEGIQTPLHSYSPSNPTNYLYSALTNDFDGSYVDGGDDIASWKTGVVAALNALGSSATDTDVYTALTNTYATIGITVASTADLRSDLADLINNGASNADTVAASIASAIQSASLNSEYQYAAQDTAALAIYNKLNEVLPAISVSDITTGFDNTGSNGLDTDISTWKSTLVSALAAAGTDEDITNALNAVTNGISLNLSTGLISEVTDLKNDINKLYTTGVYGSVSSVGAALSSAINALSLSGNGSGTMGTGSVTSIATAIFNVMNQVVPRTTAQEIDNGFTDTADEFDFWRTQTRSALASIADINALYTALSTTRTYSFAGVDVPVTLGLDESEFTRDINMLLTYNDGAYPTVQAIANAIADALNESGNLSSGSDLNAIYALAADIEGVLDDYITSSTIFTEISGAINAGLNTVSSMAEHLDNLSAGDYTSGADLAAEIIRVTSVKGSTGPESVSTITLKSELTSTLNALYERDGDFTSLLSAAQTAIGTASSAAAIEAAFSDYFVPLTTTTDLGSIFDGSGDTVEIWKGQVNLGSGAITAEGIVSALDSTTGSGFDFKTLRVSGSDGDLAADLTALVTSGAYETLEAVRDALQTAITAADMSGTAAADESALISAIHGVLSGVNRLTEDSLSSVITAGTGNLKPVSIASAIGYKSLSSSFSATNIVDAINELKAATDSLESSGGILAGVSDGGVFYPCLDADGGTHDNARTINVGTPSSVAEVMERLLECNQWANSGGNLGYASISGGACTAVTSPGDGLSICLGAIITSTSYTTEAA